MPAKTEQYLKYHGAYPVIFLEDIKRGKLYALQNGHIVELFISPSSVHKTRVCLDDIPVLHGVVSEGEFKRHLTHKPVTLSESRLFRDYNLFEIQEHIGHEKKENPFHKRCYEELTRNRLNI